MNTPHSVQQCLTPWADTMRKYAVSTEYGMERDESICKCTSESLGKCMLRRNLWDNSPWCHWAKRGLVNTVGEITLRRFCR